MLFVCYYACSNQIRGCSFCAFCAYVHAQEVKVDHDEGLELD